MRLPSVPRCRHLLVFVATVIVTATGCWTRVLPTIDPSGSGGYIGSGGFIMGGPDGGTGGTGGPRASADKLDILFMIDDSNSMAPLQAKMRAQIPAFLATLVDPIAGKLPHLHVGVVSSSYGGGRWGNVNQCHAYDSGNSPQDSLGDDRGRLLQGAVGANPSPCTMLHAGTKFLDTGDAGGGLGPNFDGTLSAALSCITNLGDQGCGFESQFESTYYALQKGSQLDDPDNGGFLRPDARLAIVMITNEDDCSVASTSLLLSPAVNSVSDPTGLGALQSYRCNEFGHLCNGQPPLHDASGLPASGVTLTNCVSAENMGKTDQGLTDPNGNPDPTQGHLWPTVAEFSDYVRMFKANPRDVVVAAIAGPTTDSNGASLYRVIPQINSAANNEIDPVIAHSCTQTGSDVNFPEYADPAVRIKQWIDSFGTRGFFYPICGADLSSPMTGIAVALRDAFLTP